VTYTVVILIVQLLVVLKQKKIHGTRIKKINCITRSLAACLAINRNKNKTELGFKASEKDCE